jgi:hypothetical protein
MAKLDAPALAQLFTEARTRNGWKSDPIPEAVLRELYDLVKFGPTAANTTPGPLHLRAPARKPRPSWRRCRRARTARRSWPPRSP